jgi:hypothetical protein
MRRSQTHKDLWKRIPKDGYKKRRILKWPSERKKLVSVAAVDNEGIINSGSFEVAFSINV